jgi:putative hydrolase
MLRNDLHIHTIHSACGLHTFWEVCQIAAGKGLRSVNITDHSAALRPDVNFGMLTHPGRIPRDVVLPDGTKIIVYKGVEANIIYPLGATDLPPDRLKHFDLIMAGFHTCRGMAPNSDPMANMQVLEAYLQNNPLDMLSHPCHLPYPLHIPSLVDLALKYGFALELNNASLRYDRADMDQVKLLVTLAHQAGARLVANSDGHNWTEIGENEAIEAVISDLGLEGDKLFLNRDDELLENFISERRALRQ